jgi:hypothetical protein
MHENDLEAQIVAKRKRVEQTQQKQKAAKRRKLQAQAKLLADLEEEAWENISNGLLMQKTHFLTSKIFFGTLLS